MLMQGLSVPFACVGSSDPVRVLRMYTRNTLDIFWSIYYWGICTTCRYRFYCVVLKPYALRLPTATATAGQLPWVSFLTLRTVLCGALYTACVDASRTVFWDRSLIFTFYMSLWWCLLYHVVEYGEWVMTTVLLSKSRRTWEGLNVTETFLLQVFSTLLRIDSD